MGSAGAAIYPLNLLINIAILFAPIFIALKNIKVNIFLNFVVPVLLMVSVTFIFAKIFPAPIFTSGAPLFEDSVEAEKTAYLGWLPLRSKELSICED